MASKREKAALVRCGGTMTEAQFLAWIRSALRSKSLRWPPRAKALELARKPYNGPVKQQKWIYQCALCNDWYKAKEVVVDHFPVAAGSILSVADIGEFANNLYCETDNLRVLCSPCHDIHTLADKNGISFEEARVEKDIIEKCKLPIPKLTAWLAQHGYSGSAVSNGPKRKLLVSKILKGV